MNALYLRAKHPRLIYRSYEVTKTVRSLVVRFRFLLEPDIHFEPTVTIPIEGDADAESLDPFIFNLGMVEAISYWKVACPRELVVKAGNLSGEQIAWWHDLFSHGLGEFFYKNDIDFTQPNFLTITSTSNVSRVPSVSRVSSSGDLIMVGGGKDSAVTLELLKRISGERNVLLLNPTPAALAVTKTAGFNNPIVVKRTIDQKLLELNKQGYLNGHTPFSAYLAFLGLLMGKIYGFSHIIASNEESSSFGNVTFHGQEINHQYSKSWRFEKMFREYEKAYLGGVPEYFSFLRPLNELQIAWLFSTMEKYHSVFKSCNVGRGERWCGTCPKCAFTYVVLSAFLPPKTMKTIFGADYFEKPGLKQYFLDLVGLGTGKPFECVGTPEETKRAIALAISQYQSLPPLLSVIKNKLGIAHAVPLQKYWNNQHFLLKRYEEVLRKNL